MGLGGRTEGIQVRQWGIGGRLVHDYANRWVEFVGSDERYGFEEVARSAETIEGPLPAVAVALTATDDRGLRAVVFADPENDTVMGGAELKGRSQVIEVTLPRKRPKSGGSDLATTLADALKKPGSAAAAGGEGQFKLVAMVADGGGNMTTIVGSASTP